MAERRYMTVIFRERDRAGIEQFAHHASTPGNGDGFKTGRPPHWTRAQLWDHVSLEDQVLEDVEHWFVSHGMTVVKQPNPNPQRMFIEATDDQILAAFGENPNDWRDREMNVRRASRIALPGYLDGYVQKITGVLGDLSQAKQRIYGLADHPPAESAAEEGSAAAPALPTAVTPEPANGLTPADIKRIYNIPDKWTGKGETIALQMLGGRPDPAVVQRFWKAHGIERSDPVVVQVGPESDRRQNSIHDFEAMMSVEWVGAMAPEARIVVYCIDPNVFPDPWATFLMEIIADEENAPTIASTSWVTPERDYYRKHGHKIIVGLLAQAACIGISVVAAAGDWGSFDGIPMDDRIVDGQHVADAPWPHGVFPAVEEGVLGVGGTMVTVDDPLTEMAWSGPLPEPLQRMLPQMQSLAGSGGFSDAIPIPEWQKEAFRKFYPRGTSSPAVVPYGRGFPDVALVASGPAVQPSRDAKKLSCRGYQALIREGWVDCAAGTSVGAPIWAAILALANEARSTDSSGLGRLGWANPVLYHLAITHDRRTDRADVPSPFRPVLAGAADIVMYAVNVQGQAVPYHFDGYQCFRGWDPVTGLGVPDVAVLIEYLCGRQPS